MDVRSSLFYLQVLRIFNMFNALALVQICILHMLLQHATTFLAGKLPLSLGHFICLHLTSSLHIFTSSYIRTSNQWISMGWTVVNQLLLLFHVAKLVSFLLPIPALVPAVEPKTRVVHETSNKKVCTNNGVIDW